MSELLLVALVQIFAIFAIAIVALVVSGSPVAVKGITALAATVKPFLDSIHRHK